jgi:2-keto-4-pentenoate hydratase/2-oxohepta-3-ene-1,7-dioic acid hydratase in catechol pathway
MKLVTFTTGGRPAVGVVDDEAQRVRDVTALLPPGTGVLELIEGWAQWGPILAEKTPDLPATALDAVRLSAPIPTPRRDIFAVGKNYREHVVEFGRSGYDQPDRSEALPEHPVVFTKATTSVTGPYDDILPHHGVTSELDYEAELGVIIGRGGRGISREDAFEHVWGYTIIDDFTARDLQAKHKQWTIGKGLDTHCPMGPYAVSADEIDDVTALHQRRGAPERPGQGTDLRHPGVDRGHLRGHHAAARRHHRHRHPGRGRDRVRPAQVHGLRRRHRNLDHRPGRAAQPHRRLTTHRRPPILMPS